MNMVLGSTAGFFAISIAKENRLEYFNTLEVYALEGNLEPFTNMIAGLESVQLDRYICMAGQTQDMKHSSTMG